MTTLGAPMASGGWVHTVTQEYSWALWLAAPILFVVLAALWSWWRGRAKRPPSMRVTMSEHDRYLNALNRATSTRPQPRFAAYDAVAPATSTAALPDDEEEPIQPHDLAS